MAQNPDPGTPDWLKRSLDRWVRGIDRWSESPSGRSWRDAFANAARRYSGSSVGGAALAERARSWSRYLPSLGPRSRAWLPRFPTPRLPEAHLPRLPRLGRMPSAPGASGLSLADAGKAILLAGAVVLVFLAVFRSSGLYERLRRGQTGWRLGPWPVRPQDVATRGQLVRAFEYLALLSLGPAARTQHHLEVARALGQQPSFDPDRRRDAARTLARLYEQARYTPEDEPLPDDDLERARRELCYLAGVPAA